VESKTRKIEKLRGKLAAAQAELRDTAAEFQAERDDLLETVRELNRQLQLKALILDRFVAPHDVELVRRIASDLRAATPAPPAPCCCSRASSYPRSPSLLWYRLCRRVGDRAARVARRVRRAA
jgi:hypothetical protein